MQLQLYSRKFLAYGLKSLFISIALAILLYHMKDDLKKIWTIPLYLILGFYFGKLTCGTHSKKVGFAATLFMFGTLNFVHSFIDGVALISFSGQYRNAAMYSHEVIRQPALYVVLCATLQPFGGSRFQRAIVALMLVTGVWLLGVEAGKIGGQFIKQWERVSDLLGCSIFLFVGDICHHLFDEFQKL